MSLKVLKKNLIIPVILCSLTGILVTGFTLSPTHSDKHQYSDEVRENYLNYCAGCHGKNLEKFERADWMFGDSEEAAFNSIKYGREEMGMPAFEVTFTDEEITELSRYIRAGVSPDNLDEQGALTPERVVQSDKQKFIIDTVVTGMDVPWGMEFLPDGDILISERAGILYRYTGKRLQVITGLPPILARGQGGLMDLRLHPDYEDNGWLYIAFSEPSEDDPREGCTSVMRARLEGNMLVDGEVIFDGIPDSRRGQHWGCKLEFDREGYLWFGIGDRGNRDGNPQTLENDAGKIHRIHDDGSIPEDNPFVNTPGARSSIYSYGHRNPQGTAMHPETGEIWETEHGPKGGDELNLIEAGKNYGWPVISYGINYNGTRFTDITEKEGMEQPVIQWTPSIAPCGMTFVDSDRYPGWKNNILIGSLSFKYLERVELTGNRVTDQEKLLENIGRVRNVKMSPDGFVYVAVERPGMILRLLPVN
jgi:glucose/arabinose dehydrogenase